MTFPPKNAFLKGALFFLSAALTLTVDCPAQYCTPASDCSGDYIISSVYTTGGSTNISNIVSGCSPGGYSFNSTMVHTGAPGDPFSFGIVSSPLYSMQIKAWVDWNNDSIFDPATEQIFGPPFGVVANSQIEIQTSIPASATLGNKRLRVKTSFGGTLADLTPCNVPASGLGETEDYIINVATPVCNGTPATATANAAATSIACGGNTTLSLTGNSGSAGLTYQWQYKSGGSWVNFGTNAATQTTPAITAPTQFRCVITCANTSAATAPSDPVLVSPVPPPVNLGKDSTICPGVAYTLNAGNPGSTYLWSTGATTQTILINSVGTYMVKVTSPAGCSNTDTIVINPGTTPTNNLNDTVRVCTGSSTLLDAGNSGSTYLWSPGGETTAVKNAAAEGLYSVTIRSADGCMAVNSTYVKNKPLPVADLGNDTAFCKGKMTVLDAGNPGCHYNWNNGSTTQTITASDSGEYSVIITTPLNCSITDQIHIAYLSEPTTEGFNFIPLFFEQLGKVKFSAINPHDVQRYEWNFGDNTPLSTAENPLHTFGARGVYNVTLTVYNDCGKSEKSQSISVDLTTGTVQVTNDEAVINLYPNPATNSIIIQNKSDILLMKHISIFNAVGSRIYDQDINNNKEQPINTATFAPGIYSVCIMLNKGTITRKIQVVR